MFFSPPGDTEVWIERLKYTVDDIAWGVISSGVEVTAGVQLVGAIEVYVEYIMDELIIEKEVGIDVVTSEGIAEEYKN